MRFELVTGMEVLGVLGGIVLLGLVGTTVTPVGEPGVMLSSKDSKIGVSSPENLIKEAQSGFQVETCVREISPQTVLSESVSGAPELVVLEGAPVTECFPGLSEFMDETRMQDGAPSGSPRSQGSLRDARAFGSDLSTSVVVLAPTSTLSLETTPTSSPSIFVDEKKTDTTATSSPSVPVIIPSGGGGTSGATAVGGNTIPSVDRFDTCRMKIFGEVIPTSLTAEEQSAFEACLLEDVAP